jgi:hypothetical protein
LDQQRVRARVDDPAFESFRMYDAAGSLRRFEDTHIQSPQPELVGGSQAGDAAPDHRDVNGRTHLVRREVL